MVPAAPAANAAPAAPTAPYAPPIPLRLRLLIAWDCGAHPQVRSTGSLPRTPAAGASQGEDMRARKGGPGGGRWRVGKQ